MHHTNWVWQRKPFRWVKTAPFDFFLKKKPSSPHFGSSHNSSSRNPAATRRKNEEECERERKVGKKWKNPPHKFSPELRKHWDASWKESQWKYISNMRPRRAEIWGRETLSVCCVLLSTFCIDFFRELFVLVCRYFKIFLKKNCERGADAETKYFFFLVQIKMTLSFKEEKGDVGKLVVAKHQIISTITLPHPPQKWAENKMGFFFSTLTNLHL